MLNCLYTSFGTQPQHLISLGRPPVPTSDYCLRTERTNIYTILKTAAGTLQGLHAQQLPLRTFAVTSRDKDCWSHLK